MNFKKILLAACFGTLLFSGNESKALSPNHFKNADIISEDVTEKDEASRYLGYGFDVTSSEPIMKPNNSIKIKAPILDVDSSDLKSKIRLFKTGSTESTNYVSKSKKTISKSLGKTFSGFSNSSVNSSIGPVISIKAGLDVNFDRTSTNSWNTVQDEEYSVYNMVIRNKTVAIQLDEKAGELTPYLSSSFLKDIGNITSTNKAKEVLQKYGTHLLTGYTLGGVLQMTEYRAAKTSKHVWQNTKSLRTQVDAAISAAKLNSGVDSSTGTSFNQTEAGLDNTDESTNTYKCFTYGGDSFTSLTIEQVFSYYSNAFKSGYMYDVWTESINKGKDLTIVEVPESSPMVPLYQILPNDSKYNKAKEYLLDAYLNICQTVLSDYRSKNKDYVVSDLKEIENGENKNKICLNGYTSISLKTNKSNEQITHYEKNENNSAKIKVKKNSKISLDFNSEDFNDSEVKWELSGGQGSVSIVDSRSGIFTIGSNAPTSFDLMAYVDGARKATYKCVTEDDGDDVFLYGSGSEANPYLIFNENQFLAIQNEKYWDKNFKLMNDLELGSITPIAGYEGQVFSGSLDGDYHTIKYTLNANSDREANNKQLRNVGLFGTLSGTIKNLNIDKASLTRNPVSQKNEATTDNSITKGSTEMKFDSVGLLIGTLKGGNVSNVFVTNSSLSLNFGSCYISKDTDTPSNMLENTTNVGGIIGLLNGGAVSSCKINDSNMYLFSQKINNINFGSLAGKIDGGLVEAVSSKGNSLKFEYGKKETNAGNVGVDKASNINMGGLVGFAYSFSSLNTILVEKQKVFSFSSVMIENKPCEFYVGGIYGMINFSNSSVNYNYVSNPNFTWAKPEGDTYVGKYKVGVFCGYSNNLDTSNSTIYSNTGGSADPLGTGYLNDSGNDSSNFTNHDTNFNSSCFDKSDYKCYVDFTNRDIYANYYDSDVTNSFFYTAEAKKKFVLGESFTTGNLYLLLKTKHQLLKENGENDEGDSSTSESEKETPTKCYDFFVDSSDFNPNAVGTYTIKLKYGNIEGSYDVEVVDKEIVKLVIEKKPNKMSYSVGDKFDRNGMILKAVYTGGTSVVIDLFNDPDLEVRSSEFVSGQNEVVFVYHKKQISLIVNASEKEVSSIKILKEPDSTNYTIGQTINLDGLKIEVNYKNASFKSEEIDYSELTKDDFGIYYSALKKGKNKIKISYKDYTMAEYEVDGSYDSVTEATLADFLNKVNSIDFDNKSLQENYESIKAAESLKNDLQSLSGDEIFDDALAKLNQAKASYDKLVKDINNDFDDAQESGEKLVLGNSKKIFTSTIATASITAATSALAIMMLILFVL